MGKSWVNNDFFSGFQDQKRNEADTGGEYTKRSEIVWPTPDKGTETKPKIYKGRFLPNPDATGPLDAFYVMYFYHMFQSGDKWFFALCHKTFDMDNFCPFCHISGKLYQGTKEDKVLAKLYKRKAKFASNWYVGSDPRDSDKEEEDKQEGKVRIYEFPSKVESKLKREITDTKEGWGVRIFDPGEKGVDFTISVKSTKPDANKKTFPDYSDSLFSRHQNPLGSDKEIEKIMSSRHGLNEYLQSLVRSDDDIIEILKKEQLWELAEDEYNRLKGLVIKTTETTHKEPEVSSSHQETQNEEPSDEDLLKELDNM